MSGRATIRGPHLSYSKALACIGAVMVAGFALGCDHPPPCVEEVASSERLALTLRVEDEGGAGVAGATVSVGTEAVSADASGVASIDLAGPEVLVVSAPGMLAEPVPVGWTDAGNEVKVRLLSDAGGQRIVIHSAGDVMLGRRYETPFTGTPLIKPTTVAEDAAHVLAAMKPAFGAADLRTINLETVVADLPEAAKYPGKRFILQTKPEALVAIKGLGVDIASLANNHARDYLDEGISLTEEALLAVGLPVVGASHTGDNADKPVVADVRGTKVGVIGYTTVAGSVVNDQYPLENEPIPPDLEEAEAWLYEGRVWGYMLGGTLVPATERRIGTAWRAFSELETAIDVAAVPPLWASLTNVYPEMQDWASRRGHGGAAIWDGSSKDRIAQLAAESDIVIVQLHAGFQFQEASSEGVHDIARDAIDAGADLVVCHHPHVLQGFEYYKGGLIAYSLGNFVFDQDFLATFASMFLRTVWEQGNLIEARVIPVEIDSYRPMPATGKAAERTMLTLWERSVLPIVAERDDDFSVRAHPAAPDPEGIQAQLSLEGNTARILTDPPEPVSLSVSVGPDEVAPIDFVGLVDARLGLAPGQSKDILVGRDLFGWGRFEDEMADGETRADTHWALDGCQKLPTTGDAPEGRGFLRLRRNKRWSVLTRAVARVPLAIHRAYEATSNTPVDPAPSYSLRTMARLTGDSKAIARFDIYNFFDADPTEDPESILLRSVEIPMDLEPDEGWKQVEIRLPAEALEGDPPANMVLLYVSVEPPRATGEAMLDLDDFQFVEWREAGAMPAWNGLYTLVRNDGAAAANLSFWGLPARR